MRKVIACSVILSLFCLTSPARAAENQATSAPDLQNFMISQNSASQGASINFSFEVVSSSPLSWKYSIVQLRGPYGYFYSNVFWQSGGTNLHAFWGGAITVPKAAPSGVFAIRVLSPASVDQVKKLGWLKKEVHDVPDFLKVGTDESEPDSTAVLYKNKLAILEEIKTQMLEWKGDPDLLLENDAEYTSKFKKVLAFRPASSPTPQDEQVLNDLIFASNGGGLPLLSRVDGLRMGIAISRAEAANAKKSGNKTKISSKESSSVKPTPKTITCTKGKLVQKVTAVNPTCPRGYLKK